MHLKCIPHLTKPLFLFSIYYSIAIISLFRKEVVLKRLPIQRPILCKFKFRIHCKGKSCVYVLKDQLESSDRGITQSNNNSKKKYNIIVYLSLESVYIFKKR